MQLRRDQSAPGVFGLPGCARWPLLRVRSFRASVAWLRRSARPGGVSCAPAAAPAAALRLAWLMISEGAPPVLAAAGRGHPRAGPRAPASSFQNLFPGAYSFLLIFSGGRFVHSFFPLIFPDLKIFRGFLQDFCKNGKNNIKIAFILFYRWLIAPPALRVCSIVRSVALKKSSRSVARKWYENLYIFLHLLGVIMLK